MRRLILIPLTLFIAGCGGHVEFPMPPKDKLVCPDEPGAPIGDGPGGRVTDEQNGEYLRSLRASWAGCKSDVDWLAAWFKTLNK